MAIFTYHINKDERGEFFADVRRATGSSVFEFKGFDLIEDGYMQHKNDTEGLTSYLVALGVFGPFDRIGTEDEAEAERERTYEVKVTRTETSYYYHYQIAANPAEAKRLAAEFVAKHPAAWQQQDVAYAAETDEE